MILIVGNILKDVYLGLDSRTEPFETDKNGTKWLDFSFDTSSHHYFYRNSNFGGAVVSLEVFKKLGLDAKISSSDLALSDETGPSHTIASEYRYILTSEDNVSYLVPATLVSANFKIPDVPPDYIYVDRSAHLSSQTAQKIADYLTAHQDAKLILYLKDTSNPAYAELTKLAKLIITEDASANLDYDRTIFISDHDLSYKNITELISVDRIDKLTHLSAYSIAAATIIGSFLLGETVEKSLKMARLNVENSNLDSTLSLHELNTLQKSGGDESLELIAATLMAPKKGILAADESGGSIKKKFEQLNIADTFKNRHDYRNLFFTTENLNDYLNGVILFDETARDSMNTGESIPDFLISQRIMPGIKVDQGLENFPNSDETYAKGLDNLEKRLREYREMGLRFAKWRAAFILDPLKSTPSDHAISENCRILASYAKACQSAGLVPIVEPEVVYDGNYSINENAETTGKILDCLIAELKNHGVSLSACIIKCNMVLAGRTYHAQSSPEEVGKTTAETLRNHVPTEIAGIVFLSGGQTPEQATENLAEILKNGPFPWPLTFSFARALQDPALYAWSGDNHNAEKAKEAFKERLQKNTEIL